MGIRFTTGQVAQGDPSPTGPTTLSNAIQIQTKVCRLTSANFTTGSVDTLIAVLPASATIVRISRYVRTVLSGGGITAATLSLGTASGGTQFVNAVNALDASGTQSLPTATAIMQNHAVPQGSDIQIWARGTATTGNPNAGEQYVIIDYVV